MSKLGGSNIRLKGRDRDAKDSSLAHCTVLENVKEDMNDFFSCFAAFTNDKELPHDQVNNTLTIKSQNVPVEAGPLGPFDVWPPLEKLFASTFKATLNCTATGNYFLNSVFVAVYCLPLYHLRSIDINSLNLNKYLENGRSAQNF